MRSTFMLICALAASCLLSAQGKPDPWANLSTLQAGDRIQIFEVNQNSVIGTFVGVTPEGLSIHDKGGSHTIAKQEIRSVKSLRGTHRLRNIAIGAGIGAGAGAGVSAVFWEDHGFLKGKGTGAAVGAVIGALGGTVFGALIPSHATIYAAGAP